MRRGVTRVRVWYWGVLRHPMVSFAALTTRARAEALASGQTVPAEGKAKPGGVSGGRSGRQLHLS
eukprot:scaffold39526_cov292-Isochrysis_galbana.AAC.2